MNALADSRLPALVVFLFVLLLLGGCAGTGTVDRSEPTYTRVAPTGTFPVPPEIQPNVDFWRNVYAKWGRNQVALHDDEYLGVIYEVINLPVGNPDGYTPNQKAIIDGHQETLKYRLRALQGKIGRGETLSSEERALRDKLVASGGTRAIYGADERVRVQRGLRERFRRGIEIITCWHQPLSAVDDLVVFLRRFPRSESRGRAEEALRESEVRFREMADLLPQAVYETDARAILTYANRHACSPRRSSHRARRCFLA